MIVRNKISELTFCKDEYLEHLHFFIKNDNMYLTNDFVKSLPSFKNIVFDYDSEKTFFFPRTGLHTTYGYNNMYRIDICIRQSKVFKDDPYKKKYRWLICASSGSYGFNGMNYTKKEQLGVRTKRKIIKFMINYYMNSELPRYEKIQKIISRING